MHGRKYRNAVRTCDVVFANSSFTADDFSGAFGFPRERVLVAHPGIAPEFTAAGEPADLGHPYLLTVATLEPRKNLGTLVDAFALLDDTGLRLAVVGGAVVGRVAIPVDGQTTLTVPLRPAGGVCTLRFTVGRTRVPGPHDLRPLGAHFLSFDYNP